MLYTNIDLEPIKIRRKKYGVQIGEDKFNGHSLFLSVPEGVTYHISNACQSLTIRQDNFGRPFIDYNGGSTRLYVILSSRVKGSRGRCGYIQVPVHQDTQVIGRGVGCDIAMFSVCNTWDEIIAEAKDGDVFRVVWSGDSRDMEPTYYLYFEGKMHVVKQKHIEKAYASVGLMMPFSIIASKNDGSLSVLVDEWRTL